MSVGVVGTFTNAQAVVATFTSYGSGNGLTYTASLAGIAGYVVPNFVAGATGLLGLYGQIQNMNPPTGFAAISAFASPSFVSTDVAGRFSVTTTAQPSPVSVQMAQTAISACVLAVRLGMTTAIQGGWAALVDMLAAAASNYYANGGQ